MSWLLHLRNGPFAKSAVAIALMGWGIGARPSHAAEIFHSSFDSAAGTNNGSAITGVTGGTAAIRHNGTGSSAVVTTAPDLGGDGYLETSIPSTSPGTPQGATFTPASAANSLAAMYSVSNGQAGLNGGFDFFVRSDTDVTAADQFRPLDVGAPATAGLRLTYADTNSSTLRVEVITQGVNGFTDNTGTKAAYTSAPFSMTAGNTYHVGVTFSTDASGNVTLRQFGIAGTGAIDTSAATPAEGLLGSLTFNFNESVVMQGFNSGSYDFGILRTAGAAKQQDYDEFRLYDSAPAEFSAIPEPTAAGFITLATIAGIARRKRRV